MSKTFKETNPALQFLQQEATEQSGLTAAQDAQIKNDMTDKYKGIVPIGQKPERYTTRLNLLLKPSTATKIKKIAAMKQASMNSMLNEVLEAYANQEHEIIATYDELFEKEQ